MFHSSLPLPNIIILTSTALYYTSRACILSDLSVILPGPPFFSPVTVHFIPRPGHSAHSRSSHLISFSLCLWSSLVTRHSNHANHANPPFLLLLFSNSFSSTFVLDVTSLNFLRPPSFVRTLSLFQVCPTPTLTVQLSHSLWSILFVFFFLYLALFQIISQAWPTTTDP